MKKSFEKEFDWRKYFIISENVIRQKEHSEIEFKESFHSPKSNDKKLHKWIAGFANAHGGLIIYGVKNNGELIGLKNRKLHDFDNKDLSQELLDYFAPEIRFELFIKNVNDFELGFLYIYEATDKPLITIKSANNTIKESDIFYRYPGQSRKIAYADLKNIIETKYQNLNAKWLELMNNVATLGVENVGLLNVINGELTGSMNKLLIPKELLTKVKFINEGHFVEKEGTPALKLIGDVQPIDSNKIVQYVETKYQMITHYELYNAFFRDDLDIETGKEFFRKVLYEASVYYPIYFYLYKSKYNKNKVLELLTNEQGIKNDKIKERFEKEKNSYTRFEEGNLNTETEAAKKILKAYETLKRQKDIMLRNLSERELRYILQAITHLKETEIEIKYIRQILKEIYDNYFSNKSITKTFIRKSICHIDLIIYGKQYFETTT